ncbi:MAG: phosphatidate cytidylyltransferase, partial [Cytophagales bacterium]|nr:phosphatidate cytidylyltransferase [Cytophagales bacterium]
MTSVLGKLSNLVQRVIAAVLGAGVILGGIYYGAWSYFTIFFLISMITQLEFYKLVGLDGMLPLKTFGTFSGSFIFLISFLVESSTIHEKYYFTIFPVVACVYMIYLYRKQIKKPFRGVAFTFLGIIYVSIPFSLINVMAFHPGQYTGQLIIGSMLILWASDTGAYFAGVRFGKRKLFERVSPKKSWEGSLGGFVLAMAMAFGISKIPFFGLETWQWTTLALIIVVTGTFGDLVESLFKR